MATQLPADKEFAAQKAAAEASDPYTDKNNRPSWWPEDFPGSWDEGKGRWVEPAPKDEPGQETEWRKTPPPADGDGSALKDLPAPDVENVEQQEPDVG